MKIEITQEEAMLTKLAIREFLKQLTPYATKENIPENITEVEKLFLVKGVFKISYNCGVLSNVFSKINLDKDYEKIYQKLK